MSTWIEDLKIRGQKDALFSETRSILWQIKQVAEKWNGGTEELKSVIEDIKARTEEIEALRNELLKFETP